VIMALLGSLSGIVIGTVRRARARRSGRSATRCDDEPIATEIGEFRPRVSALERVIPLAAFGIGLVVLFLLFVVDPPVIDSRSVAETLLLGGEADARSTPIRSTIQVWQSSGVEALAFSSDARYLATGGHDGTIGIWSAGDWTRAGEIKQEGWVAGLAFSPDGQWLYVAGDDGRRGALLCRFRWRTGKQDKVFDGHKRPVDGMALSADGRTLVSSSFLRAHPSALSSATVLHSPTLLDETSSFNGPATAADTPRLIGTVRKSRSSRSPASPWPPRSARTSNCSLRPGNSIPKGKAPSSPWGFSHPRT
jgi:WD40 repeat protein